jgi:hypothetical protein
LYVTTFDKDQWKFRTWYFEATGFVSHTAAGEFDAATSTLTMTNLTKDNLVLTKRQRFVDVDTTEWTVTTHDRSGKTVFSTKGVGKRLAGGAKIDESAGGPAVPKEMSVLDRLAGTWDTEMSSRVRADARWRVETRFRPVLGGRFVEWSDRVLPSGEENYTLLTFDPQAKEYRQWYFSSRWSQATGSGVWDEATKTMTWSCAGGDERTKVTWTVAGPDRIDFRVTVTGPDGKVLEDLTGAHTRRAK